jgi:hypothetical protein
MILQNRIPEGNGALIPVHFCILIDARALSWRHADSLTVTMVMVMDRVDKRYFIMVTHAHPHCVGNGRVEA